MTEYVYGTDEHEGHWLTGEEVVRCRDCQYAWAFPERDGEVEFMCCNLRITHLYVTGGNDFCSKGKRRDA